MNITKKQLEKLMNSAYTVGKNDLSNIVWDRAVREELIQNEVKKNVTN